MLELPDPIAGYRVQGLRRLGLMVSILIINMLCVPEDRVIDDVDEVMENI